MAEPSVPGDSRNEAFWRDLLTHGHPRERFERRFFIFLPRDPRCRICAAPFAGLGGPVMRLIGKRRSDRSPNLCTTCFDFLAKHRGGAEIEGTMLFADIRGSTTLAESMSPAGYHDVVQRFYQVASQAVFEHDGTIDKFVGDEVVAIFYPMLAAERHAAQGVAAARAILSATGHGEPGGPWVPVGIGVHTGTAWVGAVGDETHVELTALGDAVNVAARLASMAEAGEVLVTASSAPAAGLAADLERRAVALKGKHEPVEVVSLRVGPPVGAPT